ncbi:MAG: secretion protein HlyD [Acidobacteria bacterium]|nr:secretion protein HlyD [Acidobacteriota bacterium]
MTFRRFAPGARGVLASLWILLVLLGLGATGCGETGEAHEVWYCPMHPTYVSDRPGACPICNMDLVKREAPKPAPESARVWTCPMHPEVVSDRPGTCPICHMDLVEKESPAAPGGGSGAEPASPGGASHATVEVGAEGLRLAGVRTEPARRERVTRTLRTVGTVVPDERRLRRAQTRIAGWVEKLHVNFEGQYVRKGQPMLSIYSPELLASQQEYLIALANARRFLSSTLPEVRRGGEDLVAAARRRLELYDVPESLIAELERTGEPRRTVDLVAPASGYVVSREVVEGRQVEPGMELYTVADLARVWVEGEFYESEARLLALGQEANLRLAYDPERSFAGRVDYVYPALDPATRTLRVRYDLDNPGLLLKPGMFVDVEQRLEVGEGIVVQDLAVLDTGREQIVFVESAPGRFEPRRVAVLWRGEGRALLAPGAVAEGESVVVKANFLLDSESRLAAALAALGAGAGAAVPAAVPPGHSGHGAEGERP